LAFLVTAYGYLRSGRLPSGQRIKANCRETKIGLEMQATLKSATKLGGGEEKLHYDA